MIHVRCKEGKGNFSCATLGMHYVPETIINYWQKNMLHVPQTLSEALRKYEMLTFDLLRYFESEIYRITILPRGSILLRIHRQLCISYTFGRGQFLPLC